MSEYHKEMARLQDQVVDDPGDQERWNARMSPTTSALYWAIKGAITAANREAEFIHLAGVEGEAPDPYLELDHVLREGLEEVQMVRNHTHQWNGDDYCDICGADGRA